MKVALFTESAMRRDAEGRVQAKRDLYPRFIRAVAPFVGQLTMVARCEDTPDRMEEATAIEEHDGFTFVGLPNYENTADFYRRAPVLLPTALRTVLRVVWEHDIVLLRVHNCLGIWIALAAWILRRPLAVYWAGPAITEAVRRNYPGSRPRDRAARLVAALETRIHRLIARLAELHFFIDEDQFALMGRPDGARWVVPTLVDSQDIVEESLSREDGALRIVFAGRLMSHKGVGELLEAVASVERRREVRVDVAGEGPERAALEEASERLGLEDVVRFHGHLKWSNLQELLRRSHVFALPSHAEGLPKVIWEAWAAGLALITCPVGSIERYVQDGVNGMLVPPGSVQELARAIESCAKDEKLRRRLVAEGLRSVRRHTWQEEVRRIGGALNQLVEASPTTPISGETSRCSDAVSERVRAP